MCWAGSWAFAIEGGSDEQAPLQALDRAGQESRLLGLVARGQRMEAVALARVLYGMGTTEAVQFIDGLQR